MPIRSSLSIVSFLLCFLGAWAATSAQSPDEALQQYILSLDAKLLQTSQDPAARPNNLKQADRYYVQLLKDNPNYYAILRSNSKGKVINEVVRGKRPVRNFRDISRQNSYKTVSGSNNPYYGFYTTRKGEAYFMWTYPIILPSDKKFAGILIAKMNLNTVLQNFAKSQESSFRILLDGKSIFTNQWKKSEGSVKKNLAVPGPQNLEVEYIPTKTMAAESSPKDAAPKAADSKTDRDASMTAKTDDTSMAAETDTGSAVAASGQGKAGEQKPAAVVKGEKPGDSKLKDAMASKAKKGFPTFAVGAGVVFVIALILGVLFARQSRREADSIL